MGTHSLTMSGPSRRAQIPTYRRVAAAIIINAIQSAEYLLRPTLLADQYYDAVEALLWMRSSASAEFFDATDLEPEECLEKIGGSTLALRALELLEKNQQALFRYYIANGRYMANQEKRKSAYAAHVAYADFSVEKLVSDLQAIVELNLFRSHDAGQVTLESFDVGILSNGVGSSEV